VAVDEGKAYLARPIPERRGWLRLRSAVAFFVTFSILSAGALGAWPNVIDNGVVYAAIPIS